MVFWGELFPKSLFRKYSFSLTFQSTNFIQLFRLILSPITFPFSFVIQKTLGIGISSVQYNKQTLGLLVESGIESGKIDLPQEKLMKNILDLSQVPVIEKGQPIPSQIVFSPFQHKKDVFKQLKEPYPQFIFIRSKKHIVGIFELENLFLMGNRDKLSNYFTSIPQISSQTDCLETFHQLLNSNHTMAIIEENKKTETFISLNHLLSLHKV